MADAVGAWTEILDPDVVEGLRELGGEEDPELFQELVELYCQDSPERIRQMVEGVGQGDWVTVEGMAHALKSSSANLGALEFSELCRAIEARCKSGDFEAGAILVGRAADEHERVEQALRLV